MELTPTLLQTATQALDLVLDFKRPADAVLSAFFRDNRKLGARDRAFVAEAVFGVLRRYRYLSVVVPAANPRTLIVAWLIKARGMSGATLEQFARPELIQHIRSAKTENLPLGVAAELPDWVVEKLQVTRSDADILTLGRALQQAAPLDVRVNAFKADRDAMLAKLQGEGLLVEATPYSPWGLRFRDHPAINRHPLFLDGTLEVQDEGSQLLALLLGARRGEMVCDFCAGAGGKTLAIGAMMASTGRLYAFDVADKRLANLKPRLARSGLSNVMPQLIASETDTRVKRLAGKLDRVLVDAPCSGLGTLRRNPDLKFRQSPQSVAELTVKQAAILRAAAKLLKPGGRLVYATCSLLAEENEAIVEAFLAEGGFNRESAADLLAQNRIVLDTGDTLTLSPATHGTDGFFAAVVTRQPA
ncbi:MAG: SAM-dependent methyltransferase [Hydrogenophilales bacterium 16-64-46]|nr:MAG: SAM-dependent methyltransferase [Hydrogenophilales bacterium 12-64-13]OYZ05262.1 MAG: SAM-dependent methyltransferase [Hydrogenophilales bacterium 16-64-46]OZA37076.1 MAG: SAM-dependent methyltransferase [Hydrogenophilales bacterium 17-64-34]HQT01305.1 RsmB/NOP family class I SAM-dependent RNA methyltransferase [Thiobacillus sp.]